jgi:hypothetical protein
MIRFKAPILSAYFDELFLSRKQSTIGTYTSSGIGIHKEGEGS